MNDCDPSAIHIMQFVLGSKSSRFQTTFLKSVFEHHFENGEQNPKPIHLHILTDSSTRFILEGVIHSWRIDHLRVSFYSAEPVKVSFIIFCNPLACKKS